jgi:hypothetical protein
MTDNELITKWCGFKIFYDETWDTEHKNPMFIPSGKPKRTHMIDAVMLPDFQNDFNACLQWVVPKLEKYCTLSFKYYNELWYCGILTHMKNIEVMVTNRSLSVAFTDAIEKLIDSEEKK